MNAGQPFASVGTHFYHVHPPRTLSLVKWAGPDATWSLKLPDKFVLGRARSECSACTPCPCKTHQDFQASVICWPCRAARFHKRLSHCSFHAFHFAKY